MPVCPRCKFQFSVYRARTTGPGSQSNCLHGFLQQLAEHTGYSMTEIKEVMKEDLPQWPHVERLGRMVAVSEADVDTAVESAAIEWCRVKAVDLGVVLREA